MRSIALQILAGICYLAGSAQPAWKIARQELIAVNPPFNECHASTIAEVAPGKLIVAFFAGTGEGEKDVTIWKAFNENNQWTLPESVADGIINDSVRYPCWNPVLFKRQGTLWLCYKVGPKPYSWWGMYKTSGDEGKTWSDGGRLPQSILGPIKNKPITLADGSILSPSSKEENNVWKVYIEKSSGNDGAWQLIPVDTANAWKVIQPAILSYPGNRLQLLCRSNQGKIVQAWSYNNGTSWSKLSLTKLPNPNSGIDAVTLKSGWQMLVYNPTTKGGNWSDGRQKLQVAISKNGSDWNVVAVLENGTSEEFSYPAIIEAADGKVHITYTWKRKNIKHVVLEEVKK